MSQEVINDLLGYPGLKIIQNPEMFNFSLDSTLLAYFTTINLLDKRILDIGCGNGFIPIFLTLKTKAKIEGIEIQEQLSDMARRSVALNNLDDQITIINDDVRGYHLKVGVSKYDVITCNPPYFIYKEDSRINKNDYLTIARHEVNLTLEELLDSAKKLLKDNGTFSLVHRSNRLSEIFILLDKYGFTPKRLQFVYPKKTDQESLICLIECKKSKNKGGLKILPPLYVHKKDGTYTKEVLKIFNYQKED